MRNCFSETTRKNAERQQREVLYGGWSVMRSVPFLAINDTLSSTQGLNTVFKQGQAFDEIHNE